MINLTTDVNLLTSTTKKRLTLDNTHGFLLKNTIKNIIIKCNSKKQKSLISLYSDSLKIMKCKKKVKNYTSTLIPKSRKNISYLKENKFIDKNYDNFKNDELSNISKIKYYNISIKDNINNQNVNLKPTLSNNDLIYNDNSNLYSNLINENNYSNIKKRNKKNNSYSNNKNPKLFKNKKSDKKNLISNKNKGYPDKKNLTCNNFYKRNGRNSNLIFPKQISSLSNNSKNKSSFHNILVTDKNENQKYKMNKYNSYNSFYKIDPGNSPYFNNLLEIRKKLNETCTYFYNSNRPKNDNILNNENNPGKNINSCYNTTTNGFINNNSYFNKYTKDDDQKLNGTENIAEMNNKNKTQLIIDSKRNISNIRNYNNIFNRNKTINKFKNNKKLNQYNNRKLENKHFDKRKKITKSNKEKNHLFNKSISKKNNNKSFSSRNIDQMKCFDNIFNPIHNKIKFNYKNITTKTLSFFNTCKNFNNNESSLMQSNIKNNLYNLNNTKDIKRSDWSKDIKNDTNKKKKYNNILNNKYINEIKGIKFNKENKFNDEEKNNGIQSNYYMNLNKINIDKSNIQIRNNNCFHLCNDLPLNNCEHKLNYNKNNDFSFKDEYTLLNSKINKRKEDLMKIMYFSNRLYDNKNTN